ncbi:MAG: 6-phosphofructokinase [Planctomycetota bacterium]
MLRCLIATLGKDAPGVNAAIRAATRIALRNGMEVHGAKRGFVGIIGESFHGLRESDVGLVLGRGGSILGSSDFRVSPSDRGTILKIARVLKGFDLVIATGGLGSFAILDMVYSSSQMGLTTTMFIPASVENDFLNPRVGSGPADDVHAESIGADTALNTAVEAVDRLREQSYLSRTLFLVQCAGAKTNYLPISIGLACGAHRIYLPRFPLLDDEAKAEIRRLFGEEFDPNMVNVRELVGWIEGMFEGAKRKYIIVVIPHGVPMVQLLHRSEEGILEAPREDYESTVLSTAPMELTVPRVVDDLLIHFSGSRMVQVRYVVLDDLQRGGAPSAKDRLLGTLYGRAAVERYLSAVQSQEVGCWGNLNLVAVDSVNCLSWKSFPRDKVTPIFHGPSPRAGGLDPLPFFRQIRGIASGYRTLARS